MNIKHPPILNINGTDPTDLLEQYQKAHKALSEAEGLMRLAMPHGRDYPRGDYDEARKIYLERIGKLSDIRKYVFELMMVVYDQKVVVEQP